jgi:cell division protein ZapA (FtsZ GTPase activity inhibitor)
MAAIEIQIHSQTYTIKSDTAPKQLERIRKTVQAKIESLLEQHPTLTATQAALLAAVEFSHENFESEQKRRAYRDAIVEKAGHLLERIEKELSPAAN